MRSGVTAGGGEAVAGGGAECPPETSEREISADLPGKERKEKSKNGAEKKENWKEKKKEGNWKWNDEKLQNEERTLEDFFFSFFFCFSLSKPLKFVLGLPKWEFSTGKNYFTSGEKNRKNNDFAPSEKYSS